MFSGDTSTLFVLTFLRLSFFLFFFPSYFFIRYFFFSFRWHKTQNYGSLAVKYQIYGRLPCLWHPRFHASIVVLTNANEKKKEKKSDCMERAYSVYWRVDRIDRVRIWKFSIRIFHRHRRHSHQSFWSLSAFPRKLQNGKRRRFFFYFASAVAVASFVSKQSMEKCVNGKIEINLFRIYFMFEHFV